MKKISIFISIIILFWLSGKAVATSPQPEEVKPGPSTTVCTTHIVCAATEKGITQKEISETHTFDESIGKKEAMEKMAMYMNNKFKEWNVSDFKIECKFPRPKVREQ